MQRRDFMVCAVVSPLIASSESFETRFRRRLKHVAPDLEPRFWMHKGYQTIVVKHADGVTDSIGWSTKSATLLAGPEEVAEDFLVYVRLRRTYRERWRMKRVYPSRGCVARAIS